MIDVRPQAVSAGCSLGQVGRGMGFLMDYPQVVVCSKVDGYG